MIFDEANFLLYNNINLVIKIILAIAIPLIILKVSTRILLKLKKSTSMDDNLFKTSTKVIHYVIFFLIFVALLEVLGINLQSIIVSLGLVSVALSLAAKDTLSNLISGVIIILEKNFVVGDVIGIDGQVGQVVKIGFKSVSLYMRKQVIVIPNILFTTKPFINYTRDGTYRVTFDIYLLNKYDLDEKLKEIAAVLEKSDLIVDNPKFQLEPTAITTHGVQVVVKVYIENPLKNTWVRAKLISQIKSEVLIEDIK